jgi:hypothetical protein
MMNQADPNYKARFIEAAKKMHRCFGAGGWPESYVTKQANETYISYQKEIGLSSDGEPELEAKLYLSGNY